MPLGILSMSNNLDPMMMLVFHYGKIEEGGMQVRICKQHTIPPLYARLDILD